MQPNSLGQDYETGLSQEQATNEMLYALSHIQAQNDMILMAISDFYAQQNGTDISVEAAKLRNMLATATQMHFNQKVDKYSQQG